MQPSQVKRCTNAGSELMERNMQTATDDELLAVMTPSSPLQQQEEGDEKGQVIGITDFPSKRFETPNWTYPQVGSISSETSDDGPDEGMLMNNLERCHLHPEEEKRERRPSRAPSTDRIGRGVWSTSEVSQELRSMGETLWEMACRGEEEHLAEAVLDPHGQITPATNIALLIAAWHGFTAITDKLLRAGASIQTCDTKGRTALHLASCAGADDCVFLLLRAGADANLWDATRRVTALHCASAAPSAESVRLLLEAGAHVDAGLGSNASKSPLHYAVQTGNVACVKLILEAGASPNTPQMFTETPLHVAAALGSAECVRLLLKFGADVRVQFGPNRATPLHLAAEDGNAACAQMLLDAGADPQARNVRQQTPLHLAALAQSAETLELLLIRGGNPDTVDVGGRSPLHSAIVKGSRSCECVRLLVEHGADVNRADTYGYTPLHIAALSEFSSCVELLIRHGGHVTARTKGGVSALSFMVRRTPDALRRFLERLDASISLHEHELGDVDCTLKLDFRVLVPRTCHGEAELLLSFIEVGQRHLLQHPLCQTFLFLKWRHIRKFFLISLFFHAIFVALHTGFVMAVYLDQDPDPPKTVSLPIQILAYALLAMNIVLMVKEIFQMAHAKVQYTKRWENWLQWLIIASVFVCVETLWMDERRPIASWQHHVAALGIFCTWLELMMMVGRFPVFGLYVQMFTTVAANFAKFLSAYSCLLIAFGLSFMVLFPNYPAFKSVPLVLLKTVVMMSGELEFEDIFYGNESTPILYPGTAHILFFCFTLLVSVVLMNLLVGLAVSDIQGLQRSAGLDRLVRQAELVSHIESMLFSRLLTFVPKGLLSFCHRNALLVTSSYRRSIYIRPNDPREARIPKDLVEASYRLVASRSPRKRKETSRYLGDIRHVSQYSSSSVRPQVDALMLEHIRGQLATMLSHAEQSVNTETMLSQRLACLTSQIEVLRQDVKSINKCSVNLEVNSSSEPNTPTT